MMKICKLIIQAVFFLCILAPAVAQDEIQYGSNNGKYITIQNTRIYYEEYGKGIPFFLLHGGFMSIEGFKNVISGLSEHFRVIAVDSPGHGRSEHADTMSYQLMADYISEMINLMGLDSVYTMGCSDGGIVSLILAHDRPDKVKRVISDGGSVNSTGYKPGILEYLEATSLERAPEGWVENYRNTNPQPEKLKKFVEDVRKMWIDLPYIVDSAMNSIEIPTLIMLGDQDNAITIEHALEMHRAIKGSELGIVPGAGHCVCDTKPNLSNEIVIDFLTK